MVGFYMAQAKTEYASMRVYNLWYQTHHGEYNFVELGNKFHYINLFLFLYSGGFEATSSHVNSFNAAYVIAGAELGAWVGPWSPLN